MRKKEKINIVSNTVHSPISIVSNKQQPGKAIANATAGVFSFSLTPILFPPTE